MKIQKKKVQGKQTVNAKPAPKTLCDSGQNFNGTRYPSKIQILAEKVAVLSAVVVF